ncbi:MAG: Uma2 family endonuclease [Saprospiraceae bacterium]|nr:Uma2 family endonuclease [Saprospiraceae bacterium]MCF8252203.1 Uma2 family endonuclease [Saprospiraceae bacterium]MCF8282001.1 Uma2 family endonuclease [Bacteroidales bacterium]MCF8311659.1 Uma2 family endonuclease [Saprospiraceae bacterium]MCF8442578.1 Uma2 family endonuclease [Saprospiraceae bacterium]
MEKITSLSQLDLEKTYTYADYLTWQFEQAVELIKGRIAKVAAPSRRHQRISFKLSGTFYESFKKNPCEAYTAPFDVRLYNKTKSAKANKDIYTVVQPDICVICDTNKLDDAGCLDAPDLIVEILSPGNSTKEMKTKKDLYAEAGVREYWIVDPERETLTRFLLQADGESYDLAQIFTSGESVRGVVFPDLEVELGEVLRE